MSADSARRFVFALHCHQPAGNLPQVMQEAYSRCYEPLLQTIQRFPQVKVCLHMSGALLEHAVLNRANLVQDLKVLVDRGQVEMLGGGFYEPVLSTLPDADAQGQLEMMSLLLLKHCGQRPKGAWLTERVWEPEVPRLLVPAGLGFTFVDDLHVKASLPSGDPADGYWVTDRAGQMLAVLPVHRGLRYRLPSDDPEAVVQELAELPGEHVLTFADDGEKFGLWPGSHEHVYEQGWLERFLAALSEAQEQGQVQSVLPGAHLEAAAPRGRVHLPSGSYDELSRWALKPEAAARLERIEALVGSDEADRAHLRGGSWADFLISYPEAGRLYGRMIWVSERLQAALDEALASHRGRPLPSALQDRLGTAQRALYRAQAADAYWRGLFAGVHLPFLRADAHAALLRAEAQLDLLQQGDEQWVSFEERDVDLDGQLEVVLSNRALCVQLRPHEGGALLALEHKQRAVSLTDVLTRPLEATDDDTQVDLRPLVHDGPSWGFLDRFVGPEDPRDVGDFARARYQLVELEVQEADEVAAYACLEHTGAVDGVPVELQKRYALDLEGSHLEVAYVLTSQAQTPHQVHFGPELSLALSLDARLRGNASEAWSGLQGTHSVAGQVQIEDAQAGLRITFDLSQPAQMHVHPVHTTVTTLHGSERIFQGWNLSFVHALRLSPGEPVRVQISLDVTEASS